MTTLEIYYMVNDRIDDNKFSVDINPVIQHTYEVKEYSITCCPINNDDSAIVITADGKEIFEGIFVTNSTNENLKKYINNSIILSVKTIDTNGNEKFHIHPMSKLCWQLGYTLYPQKTSEQLLNLDIDNTHKIVYENQELNKLIDEDRKKITQEDIDELARLLDNDEFDIDNL